MNLFNKIRNVMNIDKDNYVVFIYPKKISGNKIKETEEFCKDLGIAYGEYLDSYKMALMDCIDVFGFSETNDGVCVEFFINNIWERTESSN